MSKESRSEVLKSHRYAALETATNIEIKANRIKQQFDKKWKNLKIKQHSNYAIILLRIAMLHRKKVWQKQQQQSNETNESLIEEVFRRIRNNLDEAFEKRFVNKPNRQELKQLTKEKNAHDLEVIRGLIQRKDAFAVVEQINKFYTERYNLYKRIQKKDTFNDSVFRTMNYIKSPQFWNEPHERWQLVTRTPMVSPEDVRRFEAEMEARMEEQEDYVSLLNVQKPGYWSFETSCSSFTPKQKDPQQKQSTKSIRMEEKEQGQISDDELYQ